MFEGRSHHIYDSGVPEIGYIVKYQYVALGSGSAFSEWRALNASQGQEVLAVTRTAVSVQAIWESRAFGIISPAAEIQVYLVSRGAPTTIVPIAAGAQHRYLVGITRGRVEFDGFLKAQPTTTPEPSLDYTVNAYPAAGGFEGVHQYQFGLQGGIQPPQPPGCPGSPGCPPPPVVATCRTPNVPPQVFLPTVRLSDLSSGPAGSVDFTLSFKDCENTTGFSYYFESVEHYRPGSSTSWGSYLSVTGTARGVMLEILEEVGGVYEPLDFGNYTWSPGVATSVRHVNGPYTGHSINMQVRYVSTGGYWYWDGSNNRWYWVSGVREGSVEGAIRTYVEYQ